MRVERLKCFLDLYEQRNFTRAAKLNFMSQTALTQFISSLVDSSAIKWGTTQK